jgi:hypothetical protein
MQTLDRDERSIHVAASPGEVYALVADVTRTPEFSPEIDRCTWLDGATGPAVGARFEAVNRVKRGSWKNRPVVKVADAGREFAFSRTEKFAGEVLWRYRFEPEGDGAQVTESYEVVQPITWFGWFIITYMFGCKDRRSDLRHGMDQTLQRLAATFDRSAMA